jgi:hypothetical protein
MEGKRMRYNDQSYKGLEIDVTVCKLRAGGFGIQNLGVWYRDGASDAYRQLVVTNPLTFDTEEGARRAGLQMAAQAVDEGVV